MFCKNCGTRIDPGNRFCPNCGTNVSGDTFNPHPTQQPTSYQTPTVPTDGLAVFAIVMGAVGMVLAWLIALFGYIFGGVGLGLGIVAKSKNKADQKPTIAIVLSSIALVFALVG